MSDEQKPVVISGAICAPPSTPQLEPEQPQEETVDASKPRQPTSMKGLLKFAMDATKQEDAPEQSQFLPLDENRKKFLQAALNSLTVDVIEELLIHIRVLEKAGQVKSDEDASEHVKALETISEYVCDIDTANDFHKIGGFAVLMPCLKCGSPKVRANTCNLLAELCQNNPYCQRVVLENGFMAALMHIVETDENQEVVVKALYAISCIVRDNTTGFAQLIQYKGAQVFLDILKRNNSKCSIKICFLFTVLCSTQPDFRSRLVFVGYIPVLLEMLQDTPDPSTEYVLELLHKLVEGNKNAINECKQSRHNTKEKLEKFLENVQGKEDFQNEEQYARAIYNILFGK